MSKNKLPSSYPGFLADVKARIRASQYSALRKVNTELIQLYWELGRMIVERQEHDGWGSFVVDRLADDLQTEFPGQTGFSRRNLYRIRDFYLAYSNGEVVPPLVAQIGWSHNAMILEKCKRPEERLFYLTMTKKFGWTKNVLATQIDNQAFARSATAHTNFHKVLPSDRASQAQLSIKDEYTFDFLELEPEHSERELERALLSKVNQFLTEMGGMFTFVGSQYRLRVDDEDFFIDLLLFHRSLRCFVAVELKITEFKPSYAGQMQFYLTALNATHRLQDEAPAIGIILCRDKKKTIVEYALANSSHPIGVASYVVSKVLPKNLKGKLPTEEQIAKLLEAVTESNSAENQHKKIPATKGYLANRNLVPPLVAQTKPRVLKSNRVRTRSSKNAGAPGKSKK